MHRSTSSTPSSGLGRRVVTRGLALGAVVAVTMLGNLRLQASEVGQAVGHSPVKVEATERSRDGSQPVSQIAARREEGVDGDVQLVPAIYAWDPDVRFVYFRHVSKWM